MCCPLAKELAEIHCNNVLLDAQILFVQSETTRGGRFVLTKMHNHLIDSLPSGESNNKGSTRSLINRLERQPYTAAHIDEKMIQEHAEGKSKWVTEADLKSWRQNSGLKEHFLSPVRS